ncbi:hypothetical protein PpBr36_05107 [Pyricularia pennisetigena]|uniref:hypothetical protein n=1 Tax=Pyricularia pennisetigena TaxID=1578925 RepID=UPI0011522974|nr:hypothetical protein PpBr36_05107 [Pyricularia pennisetigena]TLS27346.1 hypothetical protein PpBr36_05107 [Pyricularia pennisetigena]
MRVLTASKGFDTTEQATAARTPEEKLTVAARDTPILLFSEVSGAELLPMTTPKRQPRVGGIAERGGPETGEEAAGTLAA